MCGLSVALDASESNKVNIKGLREYQIPSAFVQNNEYVLDDDDLFYLFFYLNFI